MGSSTSQQYVYVVGWVWSRGMMSVSLLLVFVLECSMVKGRQGGETNIKQRQKLTIILLIAHPGDCRCRHGCRFHHHLSRRHATGHWVSTLWWSPPVSAVLRSQTHQWQTKMFVFDFNPCCYRVEPTQEGDYQICFDNSFSRFSEKMVFFEIIIEGQGGDVGGDEDWAGLEEPDGNLLEYKLEDIRVRCSPHNKPAHVILELLIKYLP